VDGDPISDDGCGRSHDVPWTVRVSLDCGKRTSDDGLWAPYCGHGSVPHELATDDAMLDGGLHSPDTAVATGAGWCPSRRLDEKLTLPTVQESMLSP